MGNIKDLAAMIPGVGKAIRDVDIPEDAFKGVEAIIQSMTLRSAPTQPSSTHHAASASLRVRAPTSRR